MAAGPVSLQSTKQEMAMPTEGETATPWLDAAGLQSLGSALDSIAVAMCMFDASDRTLMWNLSFLRFFPEHAGHVNAGEPYSANLRRFYGCRLSADELPHIDRYIEDGIARHRAQKLPFEFDHRGRRIMAASLPLTGGRRVRLWKELQRPAPAPLTGLAGTDVLDRLPDGLAVGEHDGTIVWVNNSFVSMYCLVQREEAVGRSFEVVYEICWRNALPDDPARAEYQQRRTRLTECLRFDGAPFELPLPGGRWSRVQQQLGSDGRAFCTHVDITQQKAHQAELLQIQHDLRSGRAALREKTSLLETMLERMEQGVLMVNAQGIVEICNRKAIELLELPPELMRDKPRFDAVLAWQWAHDEFRRSPARMQDFIRGGTVAGEPQCYERMRPNGRMLEIQSVPLQGGGMLRTYTDITERKRAEAEIRHAAQHDPLTGLANRRAFEDALNQAIGPAGSGRQFALHYIDLDRFKLLNDQFGHGVGDQVLVAVSQRMRNLAREADTVARLGGDEFAIVQYGCDNAAMALNLAQRVLDRLNEPLHIRGSDGMLQLSTGASIGVAIYPASSTQAAGLMANADRAMYAAKAAGGQRAVVHPPPA